MEKEKLQSALGTAETTIGALSPTTISDEQRTKLKGINETLGSISELLKKTPPEETKAPTISEYFQPDYTQDKGYRTAQDNLYKLATGADVVDTEQIRSQKIAEVQDRINALNQIYAQQLADVKKEGVGRVGSGTAILASRGLAGTGRGGKIQEDILTQNRELEGAVRSEQALAIQQVLAKANEAAVEEARSRREAIANGATAYIEFLKGSDERKNNNVTALASNLLANGVDITNVSDIDAVAKQMGVSRQTIIAKYNELKKAQDIADAQAEAEALKAEREGEFNLSEGQARYDSKGNLIASRGKTFAPKEGTGTTGGTTTASPFANDLDAIIGNTLATIPTKFGQGQFQSQINRARNDADKISTVASVVLKNAPSEVKNDFANQAIGVSNIDKAIKIIDEGTKSGFINDKLQYTFNLFGRDYDPKLSAISAYITSAVQPYRNSVTGAAWGEQEDSEYSSLFGSTKYSPSELKERLVRVKEIMKDKSAQGLNVYVNPLDTYSNVFTSQTSTNDQYAEFRSQLQPGEILVQRGGNITAVLPGELLSTDIKL